MCSSVCIWEFIYVCAGIHLIPAGFPLQSPQSDTTDDGCAAVICFIRLSGCFPLVPPVRRSRLRSNQNEGKLHLCLCSQSKKRLHEC